ncbi:hypothetical protein JHK86_009955 [Glycine max]|nr:hypothetical protein JHK86_009955 [Glycine max]
MASENKVVGDDVVEISTTKKIWPQNIGSHFITLLEEEVKKAKTGHLARAPEAENQQKVLERENKYISPSRVIFQCLDCLCKRSNTNSFKFFKDAKQAINLLLSSLFCPTTSHTVALKDDPTT